MLKQPLYDVDHESFRDSVRRFLQGQVVPSLDSWRAAGATPKTFFAAAGEQGLLGIEVPQELGGGGVDDPRFRAVLVQELMSTGATGIALLVAHHVGVCVPALLRLPESGLRNKYLAAMASGESLAVPVLLNGDTDVARSVPGAGIADLLVVCEKNGEDFTVSVIGRAECEVTMAKPPLGCREAAVADVRLASTSLAERPGSADGEALVRDLDLWAAVVAVSGSRNALDLTLRYVAERHVFGQPVASFENTRFRLAELAAAIAGAEAYAEACLDELAEGKLGLGDAAGARLVCQGTHDRMVDQGMQLHGGYGYMREYPISHAFGDAAFLKTVGSRVNQPREVLARGIGI